MCVLCVGVICCAGVAEVPSSANGCGMCFKCPCVLSLLQRAQRTGLTAPVLECFVCFLTLLSAQDTKEKDPLQGNACSVCSTLTFSYPVATAATTRGFVCAAWFVCAKASVFDCVAQRDAGMSVVFGVQRFCCLRLRRGVCALLLRLTDLALFRAGLPGLRQLR